MKRFLSAVALSVLCFTIAVQANPIDVITPPSDDATEAQWDVFSKNLVSALNSDNEGVRNSAMRLVIQYHSKVNVKDAMITVMRIYNNSDSENVRRMAVLTLSKMNSNYAMNYLKLSEKYERSESVQRTIKAVLGTV